MDGLSANNFFAIALFAGLELSCRYINTLVSRAILVAIIIGFVSVEFKAA